MSSDIAIELMEICLDEVRKDFVDILFTNIIMIKT